MGVSTVFESTAGLRDAHTAAWTAIHSLLSGEGAR
jgi:hypothetical protein